MIYQHPPGSIREPYDINISATTLEVASRTQGVIYPRRPHLKQKFNTVYGSTSLRKLRNRVFDNHNLRKYTKVMVYKAVWRITTLLYGSEAWVTHRCNMDTLDRFHQHCLRKILSIRWEDGRTNANILLEANTW